MKLIYITNTRLPSEKANSYQSIQMCSSFSKYLDEVELWTGKARNTSELSGIKDVFGYYNIEKSFLIRKFFQFDSIILRYLNEFVWANCRDFVFSVNVCLHLIRYRKSEEVLIYTRVWYLLYVFLLFKKIGLVDSKIFYESHKFSKFLLKPLSRIDGLIVINDYLYSLYEDNGLKKLFVAHDGVNIDEYKDINDYQFQLEKEEFNVVYTGSLFLWKGVNTLVDSLQYLPNNVKLIFVGGSDQYLVDFKKYVKDSGGKNRVTIVPHIPKKDLLQYLEIADVLVLPNSAKEKMSLYTSPIKMFEYMASKRPIVASDLPSIKEILSDQDNAILFNSDNPKDLANKILNVLKNDCSKLVQRALNDVEPYTWDKRANNITKFIKD
jgi:glycosyltransferase involved in cell wall biosynthesis